jgi:hypothetical protein
MTVSASTPSVFMAFPLFFSCAEKASVSGGFLLFCVSFLGSFLTENNEAGMLIATGGAAP